MAQIFEARDVLLLKLGVLGAIGGLVVAIIVGRNVFAQAPAENSPVVQDPPFSHKHHVSDVGLDCRFCHISVETSAFAGIPPSATCMTCHSQLFHNQDILRPLFASMNGGPSLQWTRVHRLPDFVYFNHGIHIAKGVGCSTCHGHVERMALMWRVQSLEMSWCIDCHRAPEQYVRPRERVFDMSWSPPDDQIEQGKLLVQEYHIDRGRLLDCSNCHR